MVIPFSFKCQVYTGYMIMKNSERKYILLVFPIITVSMIYNIVLNLIFTFSFLMVIHLNTGRVYCYIRITVVLCNFKMTGQYSFCYRLERFRYFTVIVILVYSFIVPKIEVLYFFF